MATLPKNLIESSLYAQSQKKITSDIKLLDSILDGVTFTIASKPDFYPLVDGYGTRAAKSEAVGEIPELTIFYKEYDEKIILLDIQILPEQT